MFSQSRTNTQESSKLEDLKNKTSNSTTIDTTTPSLFKSDANTGLFRTVTDPANALPPYMQQSSLNTTKPSPVPSNTILPVERKVTASKDNSLPAFFIGAQPINKPSTGSDSTTISSSDHMFDKRESISIAAPSEATTTKKEDIKEQPKKDTIIETTKKEPIMSNKSSTSHDTNHSKTIKVFGYSRNIISLLIDHFSKYGVIEHHVITNDNVLSIQYETKASAMQALKDHGLFFNQHCKIGVILAEQNLKPSLTHITNQQGKEEVELQQQQPRLRRVEHISDDQLFLKKKKGLGSGYAGISALGNRNVSKQDITAKPDIISKYRDLFNEIFFGW